jgi:hypothetical protein
MERFSNTARNTPCCCLWTRFSSVIKQGASGPLLSIVHSLEAGRAWVTLYVRRYLIPLTDHSHRDELPPEFQPSLLVLMLSRPAPHLVACAALPAGLNHMVELSSFPLCMIMCTIGISAWGLRSSSVASLSSVSHNA